MWECMKNDENPMDRMMIRVMYAMILLTGVTLIAVAACALLALPSLIMDVPFMLTVGAGGVLMIIGAAYLIRGKRR